MELTTFIRKIFLITLLCIISTPVCAHHLRYAFSDIEDWRWVRFTAKSGLPNSEVRQIIEISPQLVWALTSAGLYYYDGFSWQQPDSSGSLPKDIPLKIFRTAGDSIAVLYDSSLYIGKKEKFKKLEIRFGNKNFLIDDALYLNGEILLSINFEYEQKFSLYRFRNSSLSHFPTPLLPDKETYFVNHRKCLFTTGEGSVWINGERGIYRYEGNGWKLKFEHKQKFSHVAFIIEKGEEVFFYLTDWDNVRGLWSMRNDAAHHTGIGKYLIPISGDISQHGEIVIVYSNGTISYFNTHKWQLITPREEELTGLSFVSFRKNGDIWLQTPKWLSLYKSSASRWSYIDYGYENTNNHINEIFLSSDSTLWVGGGSGFYRHDKSGKITIYSSINGEPLNGITGITEDTEKNIWIASGASISGAYRWDGKKWKHFGKAEGLDASRVHRIRRDRSGRLWFLTLQAESWTGGGGAYCYDKGKFTHISSANGLLSDRVYSFVEDKSGALWFGSLKGISRLKNGIWKHWPNSPDKSDKIFCLALDSSGTIWYSRMKHGFGYIKNDSLIELTLRNEVNKPVMVIDIQTDAKGRIWLSTQNDGLFCYRNGIYSPWAINEGLLSVNLWPLLVDRNKVYIGTMGRGLNILSLEEENSPTPKIKFNKPVLDDNSVSVSWLPFSWWGRRNSENVDTRYRINGGAWSEWSRTDEAEFANLSPGDYLVEVQAKGLFASLGKVYSHSFTIPAPFYKRVYFQVPVIIAGLVILYLSANLAIKKRKYGLVLRKINSELEQKVRERTRELLNTNEQLVFEIAERRRAESNLAAALEKEKELSELKSRFVSLVSHEFRTPLSVIQSSSEIIRRYGDKLEPREKEKFFKRISDSILHITELMNDVLFVGKSQSGKLQYSPEITNVRQFCLQIIDEFSSGTNFNGPDPRIEFSFDAEDDEYLLDKKLLRPILMNLLSNALKYSPAEKKVLLAVSSHDGYLRLRVHDDGIGIPEEHIPKIFEAFYRADNVENIQGTGLGMAIVKDCVELHRGKVSVQSSDEEGTDFIVELPVAVAEYQI